MNTNQLVAPHPSARSTQLGCVHIDGLHENDHHLDKGVSVIDAKLSETDAMTFLTMVAHFRSLLGTDPEAELYRHERACEFFSRYQVMDQHISFLQKREEDSLCKAFGEDVYNELSLRDECHFVPVCVLNVKRFTEHGRATLGRDDQARQSCVKASPNPLYLPQGQEANVARHGRHRWQGVSASSADRPAPSATTTPTSESAAGSVFEESHTDNSGIWKWYPCQKEPKYVDAEEAYWLWGSTQENPWKGSLGPRPDTSTWPHVLVYRFECLFQRGCGLNTHA